MALFDFLKKFRSLGKKKTEVAEPGNPFAAPLGPFGRGATAAEQEFLKHQRAMRTHRGRLFAPKELQDRPTSGASLKIQDDFFYYGETVTLRSSWLETAAYDREKLELTLTFSDPQTSPRGVVVSDVSWSEALDFIQSPSFGVWVWENILVRGEGNRGKTRKPVRQR